MNSSTEQMTTIGIVGLGLIGGSLGLDLRSHSFNVLGISHRQETCEKAKQIGAVDEYIVLSENSEVDEVKTKLLQGVEIVFICTPIDKITPTLKRLIPYLLPKTIVTDVGSVKTSIVEECSQLWKNFVGGHPMAGTARQGIEAAQNDLFVGAAYVLTPTETTPPIATRRVEEIAQSLGSIIYTCMPEEHDRAVAWISHLPVVVSAALIDACTSETDLKVLKLAKQLASSGFRDTSRVGAGNPELGLMMAQYNQENLLRSLFSYRARLDRLIDTIERENWDNLESILELTQRSRPEFLSSSHCSIIDN
ncbi:prephenate dehydrogenase [Pleurocapsa sp. PCC 7327]|uniref:prephenate/arogenate dehydrogenase n=1 Tax=Pleurocapsa sp. PCC 7327 TaxID=118163 RepID=UPI00029FFA15|nr:prephenate/arogenate dehydrogenase [Pleurocapsa sp. PCC 7327]AFY76159.1 prephenate dehydrogenase [Pleurocapsa sp. PCC 7327]